jgi:small subunit ribosomal protein S2
MRFSGRSAWLNVARYRPQPIRWDRGRFVIVADVVVKNLIESGVHFGHSASRWNPKMAPYIYARKNQLHIIDIRETVRGLLRARKYISQVVEGGSLVLFVGTKRQASGVIEREALRCGMPFVCERWLGGTLTNFRTIRSRMSRLLELEELRGSEQLRSYSKKMQSSLNREYRKMYRNLNGLRDMNRLPECVIVIDPKKERNAAREARKIGVASIALIDTDCDPDDVDLPIPGNDDGIRSIELIIRYLSDAVMEAKGITDPIADISPFQLLTPPGMITPAAAEAEAEPAAEAEAEPAAEADGEGQSPINLQGLDLTQYSKVKIKAGDEAMVNAEPAAEAEAEPAAEAEAEPAAEAEAEPAAEAEAEPAAEAEAEPAAEAEAEPAAEAEAVPAVEAEAEPAAEAEAVPAVEAEAEPAAEEPATEDESTDETPS